jgi:hypothetical protein
MRKNIILNPNQEKVIKKKLDIVKKRRQIKSIAYSTTLTSEQKLAMIRSILK